MYTGWVGGKGEGTREYYIRQVGLWERSRFVHKPNGGFIRERGGSCVTYQCYTSQEHHKLSLFLWWMKIKKEETFVEYPENYGGVIGYWLSKRILCFFGADWYWGVGNNQHLGIW